MQKQKGFFPEHNVYFISTFSSYPSTETQMMSRIVESCPLT